MKFQFKIFLFALMIPLLFMTVLLSNESINFKIYKCEKFCKERYETCSLKASIAKGREKNKIAGICETRLFDCRERCRKIK